MKKAEIAAKSAIHAPPGRQTQCAGAEKWSSRTFASGPDSKAGRRRRSTGGLCAWAAPSAGRTSFPTGLPSVGSLLFGGWNRLLEAAGIYVNKPSWTPEEILAALRAYAEAFGRPPAKQELEFPPTGFPSARTVRRHFGSFTAGIRAAGLEPREKRWSEEAIIEAMREFERETDCWPRSSDWTVACEDWPSASTVYNPAASAVRLGATATRLTQPASYSRAPAQAGKPTGSSS